MKHIILLGPPGSGKGTQAAKLVDVLGYKHLSTGDLLRSEIAKGSALGDKVKSVLDAGDLVSDDLVIELILANSDLQMGHYIFDGYPRNIEQAKTLESQVLKGTESVAVFFDIDTEGLIDRIVNRRVCKGCGAIYNLKTKAPKEEGICDLCGDEVYQREDDQEEVIRNRMSVYSSTITPVLNFYRDKSQLVEIIADKEMGEVFGELQKAAKS